MSDYQHPQYQLPLFALLCVYDFGKSSCSRQKYKIFSLFLIQVVTKRKVLNKKG